MRRKSKMESFLKNFPDFSTDRFRGVNGVRLLVDCLKIGLIAISYRTREKSRTNLRIDSKMLIFFA